MVQIDVSTVAFDRWNPTGDDALLLAGAGNYLSQIDEALRLADKAGPFDLILYNAGMDPIDSGVHAAALKQRERMVAEWASSHDYPLVFALAGGYTGGGITMKDLVQLHKLTIEAFGCW